MKVFIKYKCLMKQRALVQRPAEGGVEEEKERERVSK